MRNDIVRGLIELITNSDDAYRDDDGRILVMVAPSEIAGIECEVTVFDKATGLTAAEMDQCFLKLGAAESHLAKGDVSRGFFGRGAKDVAAFGGVRFSSIKAGNYTELWVDQDGKATWTADDVPVSDAHREATRLSEGETGTAVTILVKDANVPIAGTLARELGSHAQLRLLVDKRAVSVEDRRKKKPVFVTVEPLRIAGTPIFDEQVQLSGGFDPIRLRVLRLDVSSDGPVTNQSRHGLLVHDGRATHMNTLFGLDREPAAGYITGVIECPQLIEILRDESVESGGASVISITRDGLVRDHPFTVALSKAVVEHIKPLIDAIAAEKKHGEDSSEELRRDLEDARRAVRSELKKILDEIEDDSTGGGGDDLVAAVQFVPERIILRPGAERVISVRVRSDLPQTPRIEVEDDCVTIIANDLEFRDHDRLPVRVAQVRLRGVREGAALVTATTDDGAALCSVNVTDREVADEDPPASLEFRPRRARVSPTRRRHLRIVAPIDSGIDRVRVQTANEIACSVLESAELIESADGTMLEGKITVVAGTEKGDVEVTALADALEASCLVSIAEQLGDFGLDFTHRIRSEKSAYPRSSRKSEGDLLVIEIWGEDPTVKVLLGDFDEDLERYDRAETPAARAMLAELISLELANHLVELAAESRKHGPRLKEADIALRYQRTYQERLVGTFHKALSADIPL
jgi:hypothetical protein